MRCKAKEANPVVSLAVLNPLQTWQWMCPIPPTCTGKCGVQRWQWLRLGDLSLHHFRFNLEHHGSVPWCRPNRIRINAADGRCERTRKFDEICRCCKWNKCSLCVSSPFGDPNSHWFSGRQIEYINIYHISINIANMKALGGVYVLLLRCSHKSSISTGYKSCFPMFSLEASSTSSTWIWSWVWREAVKRVVLHGRYFTPALQAMPKTLG